jgi:predicted metal-binding membrane protein
VYLGLPGGGELKPAYSSTGILGPSKLECDEFCDVDRSIRVMETASLRQGPARSGAMEAGSIALLFVLAGAAWLLSSDRMTGMDAGPGTDLGGLGWFVGVWVTMMAAMMLPSFAPMVIAYARIKRERRRRERTAAGATVLFIAGYVISWGAAGLLGYAIIESARSLDVGFLAWDELGAYVAGAVILAAAVYQLTPLKDSCLRECRSPRMLLQHWRPGGTGALKTGTEHGGFCVGCCWALMAALFALGVMSIGWMVFVAALIAAEKLLPWKAVANRGIAVLLAALAIAVAFAPAQVPALTIPGSPEAMKTMRMGDDAGGMDRKQMQSPAAGADSMGEPQPMGGATD